MLFTSLSTAATAFFYLTSSVTAAPMDPQAPNLESLATKMQLQGLPTPDGLELKYVLLGIGTQNYTCTGNETAAPGTTGATAKLYDLGTRLSRDPMAPWKINTISGLALSLSSFGDNWLEAYLRMEGYNEWVGNHFFTQLQNSTTMPTFSLYKLKTTPYPIAMVAKKDQADAPKTACPGTTNEGAVAWLRLVDDKNLSVGGVNTVYRIETAGGKAPATCSGQEAAFEVKYSAQYWIFGPKA